MLSSLQFADGKVAFFRLYYIGFVVTRLFNDIFKVDILFLFVSVAPFTLALSVGLAILLAIGATIVLTSIIILFVLIVVANRVIERCGQIGLKELG